MAASAVVSSPGLGPPRPLVGAAGTTSRSGPAPGALAGISLTGISLTGISARGISLIGISLTGISLTGIST